MSSLQDINPVEPLLWINEQPLFTLTYLWHLSQEDLSDNGKIDLLWKLTKQLLVAVYHKDDYPILSEELKALIEEIQGDSTVTALLKSKTITEETLAQILTTQEIDIRHQQSLLNKFREELAQNDTDIQKYYEEHSNFSTEECYEIYEYLGERNLTSSTEEELASLDSKELSYFGALAQHELDELFTGKTISERELPVALPHPQKNGKFLFIKAFHSLYKAPYDLVKPRLIEIFAQSMSEQAVEEEAQNYLQETEIRYNEVALEKALQLADLWK